MCNDLVSFRPSVHLRSKTLGYDEARRASRIPRAKKNKPFACSIGGFFFPGLVCCCTWNSELRSRICRADSSAAAKRTGRILNTKKLWRWAKLSFCAVHSARAPKESSSCTKYIVGVISGLYPSIYLPMYLVR